MQTATPQPLAAGLIITPTQHGLSFTSSGRWVAPPMPRRRSGGSTHHRRTASKVSCSSFETVVTTIDSPKLASRKVVHKEGTREKNITMKAKLKLKLKPESFLDGVKHFVDIFSRQWLFIELHSSELDPETEKEREPVSSFAHCEGEGSDHEFLVYEARFSVPASFGPVGAVRVENHHHQEMFIKDITVSRDDGGDAVCFPCNSWVVWKDHNPKDKRIFFPQKSYLPWETPNGLEKLRKSELEAIRGDGAGMRMKTDRIYDYDVYNDLGDPDTDVNFKRPVLGGTKEYPYPRRCRTGRKPCETDPSSEKRVSVDEMYVPRDEAFSEHKQQAFHTKAILTMLHEGFTRVLRERVLRVNGDHDQSFPSLEAIDALYKKDFQNMPPPEEGGNMWSFGRSLLKKELVHLLKLEFSGLKDEIEKIFEFETPEIIKKDKLAWFRDEEFARETLAGMNPMSIQLVTELPIVSQLDEKKYAPRESLINKELIEKQINCVMTADEAVEKKRLFMLDYHDMLLPYVHKVRALINKIPKPEHMYKTTLYGSRTLFFLTDAGTLKPIAIELTRPNNEAGDTYWRHVFTPDSDGSVTGSWLWQLAKTHVLAHDTAYHQLINHWLRTHCCVEPIIIAANRQLSQMHPIYRLLHPHFRYTMEMNAIGRVTLMNAKDGIIETTFSTGKYSVEMSSKVYDKFWRFDMEALPNDLIRRGMAVQGEDGKLKLTIEDYPYANDGLLVWDAIKEWASDYVGHYYQTAADIADDQELQAWWTEVRTRAHEDKKDEPWWPKLNSHKSLVHVLATIIWVTSAHHAAVNFGQYPFAGYSPNRPTIARINIPLEDEKRDMAAFVENPESVLLDTLPSQFQSLRVMTTLNLLSSHSPDEEYIGMHFESAWEADDDINSAFQKFKIRMRAIRDQIDDWNKDSTRKNRYGPGVVPYSLLMPCDGNPWDENSEMEMGIPNSISI